MYNTSFQQNFTNKNQHNLQMATNNMSKTPINKVTQFKGKPKRSSSSKNNVNVNSRSKFVGVRQRPSGRWVAEIKDTTQKIRIWLETFEIADATARAYDEAACLFRGFNTKTNFVVTHVSSDSPLTSRIKNILKK